MPELMPLPEPNVARQLLVLSSSRAKAFISKPFRLAEHRRKLAEVLFSLGRAKCAFAERFAPARRRPPILPCIKLTPGVSLNSDRRTALAAVLAQDLREQQLRIEGK